MPPDFTHNTLCWQGHIGAATAIGDTYFWGQGVAIDYPRAMAAYKVGAEAGYASCQYQVGMIYYYGNCLSYSEQGRARFGAAVDYEQARLWLEKAAAQDDPDAVGQLGVCAHDGNGMTPSWRRAREYYQRAIDLGDSQSVKDMQTLTRSIQQVTHGPQ